jgi:hypothetical protein
MCLRDRQPNALLRGIITFWVGEQNTLRFAILCLWNGGRLSYLKRLCFMNLPQILAVQIFTWPWSLVTKLVQVYTSISDILQYLEEVETFSGAIDSGPSFVSKTGRDNDQGWQLSCVFDMSRSYILWSWHFHVLLYCDVGAKLSSWSHRCTSAWQVNLRTGHITKN